MIDDVHYQFVKFFWQEQSDGPVSINYQLNDDGILIFKNKKYVLIRKLITDEFHKRPY